MDKKEEEFLKKLISTFRIEAKEHINAITEGLIELEKVPEPEQLALTESIFREAHSLKGAARSVNLKEIESVCQSMESVFASLKKGEIHTSPQLFDALHSAVDLVSKLIFAEEGNIPEGAKVREIKNYLESAAKGSSAPDRTVPEPPKSVPESPSVSPEKKQVMSKPENAETIRISMTKLDSLLFQIEDMLSAKLSSGQRASELQDISDSFEIWEKEWSRVQPCIRMMEEKKQMQHKHEFARLLEFLRSNQTFIKSIENKLTATAKNTDDDNRQFGIMVDNLLDDMKKTLMLPFSMISGIFPKLVRDLSHDQGKEVSLVVEGGEIEVDRRILEEMKDPLIHILRNCIDHGIEKPDERKRKNKQPMGNIRLYIAAKDGNKIEISVSDDGAGMDVSRIRSIAVEHGLASKEHMDKLNDQEALSFIFISGVSTSPIITEVSGRGLGLAIVREKIEKLHGIISFTTQKDIGSTFQIILPLTLARFRGLLVDVNEQLFVLPVTNVERTLRIKKEDIKTVENRAAFSLNGRIISFVSLADVLELRGKPGNEPIDTVQVVVVGSAQNRMAFMVDEILHEQEVLVKNLGKQLSRVRNIAGAAVLGSGKIVPILNVPDLLKSAIKVMASPVKAPGENAATERKAILVAEDSITARTLLKNILETSGYDVRTAVDGLDALTALKTREFDAVVSDVDMPGMNGFELTSRIRSDKKLSDLPVVLVTALESKEDKERGIEVGANAYIVKSSFDQSNLLEVIRSLI